MKQTVEESKQMIEGSRVETDNRRIATDRGPLSVPGSSGPGMDLRGEPRHQVT